MLIFLNMDMWKDVLTGLAANIGGNNNDGS